jgi:hypothetical protein
MRENKFGGGLLLQMVRFLRNDDIPSGTSSQLVSNRMVSWGTAICDGFISLLHVMCIAICESIIRFLPLT